MPRFRVAAFLLALGATLAAGCDYDDTAGYEGTTLSRTDGFETFERPGEIDDTAGTYRGVGIGDSVASIKRVFGEQRPAGEEEAGTPFRYPDGGDDGPWVIQFEESDPFGPVLRYLDVVFDFKGEEELGAFVVVEPGATTLKGVGIGDTLDRAESAYPELLCGTVNEDTEYAEYPACTGQLASDRYIWFGGDPIKSIALSTHEFGGL